MKGLGSPHLRGEGQPSERKVNWREGATWREAASDAASGCSYVGCMFLLIPLGIIGVIAALLGIDAISGWVSRGAMGALDRPLGRGALGVALVLLAAWGMFRVVSLRSTSGVTVPTMIGCGVIALAMILLGIWAIVAALTGQVGAPSF
jgi:hypothetical protein